MSELSGLKGFMRRLRFREKSRRPKHSKSKMNSRRSDSGDGNPTTPDGSYLSGDRRKGISENVAAAVHLKDELSSKPFLGFKSVLTESVLVDVCQNPTNDACDSAEYLNMHSTERKNKNGIGLVANNACETRQSSNILGNTASNNGETERGRRDSGSTATKKRQLHGMTESLSDRDPNQIRTQQQLVNENDDEVWQMRKSALFLNTYVPSPRRSSTVDSFAEGYARENNPSREACGQKEPSKCTVIHVRRNTGSSELSSLDQYVNVPEMFKSKQIHKLKQCQGEWDRYDSEENAYHHLAAVVGPLGYQNVPGEAKGLSVNSLNGPSAESHLYENVAGDRGNCIPLYKTKPQQTLNYIKLSGSEPLTSIQKASKNSFGPRKQSSGYVEIDTVKTQRLREMAKETKVRVKKSYKY